MSEPTPEESAAAAVDTVGALLAEAAGLESAVTPAAGSGPLASLATHTQGLLRIRVPVAVTLAAQRKSIQEIIELGPGAIIKFDKTCDQPLDLCVGELIFATGEVVKVGDKFGLRVGRLKQSP